ncbi:IclR family transcriptional regulator [Bacillus altitudinis]|uniref:IclR family transcriptional regulator n=1 Tax=Bacillus altitudinis TaxID=293387 RepID=UPI0004208FE2|nr:IclR family transcriptional regulator [Bacillus altitudinis]MDR4198671.1 IclR family transcriptional regulator [Bacillus altitudinis]
MQNTNKTVVKSMEILRLFITREQLTLNDMIELSSMPKTSVHRMANSLADMGLLEKHPSGVYRLGLVFLEYGQLVADRLDIRRIARPFMENLRDEVGEAVQLIIREGDEAIYVEKMEGTQPVRLYTAVGRRSPLYAGACARSILSFLPEEERLSYIDSVELGKIGIGTITDKDVLRNMIEESNRRGYTLSYSELENYTAAIGAPIFNHHGEVAAGISIAGFEAGYQKERLPYLIEQVKKAASGISKELGFTSEQIKSQ